MTKAVGTAGWLNPDDTVYEDITNIPVEGGASAGIRWRAFTQYLVPTFEEHMVRKEWGYNLRQWGRLPVEEKALEIAVSRIQRAIEAHESEAQSQAMKKK